MAIKVNNTTVIDNNRNLTNIAAYNGYTPVPPTRTITAGTGLIGGGNLGANRTISLDLNAIPRETFALF